MCHKRFDESEEAYLIYQGRVSENCFVQTGLPLNILLCKDCIKDVKLAVHRGFI